MKKYAVRYDTNKGYAFAREIIEARGLMHAFKLAKEHLREIKKTSDVNDLRIAQIHEVEEEASAED